MSATGITGDDRIDSATIGPPRRSLFGRMGGMIRRGGIGPGDGADHGDKRPHPADTNPLAILGRRRRDRILILVLLTLLALWWIFPIYSMVGQALDVGGWSNFQYVLTKRLNNVWLPRTFLNSAIVAVLHALLVCSVGALAGYAFSRIEFPGRETIFYGTLAFLAVPATAMLIPFYRLAKLTHLFNNPLGIALPEAALTIPFAVLLMRNFGDGLSMSFFEAAKVDGATHWQQFRYVYLPLSRPTLINLGALSVMWSFHDFAIPSMVAQDPQSNTAAQAVQTIRGAFSTTPLDNARYFAALSLLAVPALLLVLFGLRWMTAGLTAGGAKE